MITQHDLQFHTPKDASHEWGETYWFGLYVPEANLYGWVYMVFRAGSGAMTCDVEFIDRKSRELYDARYIDIQNHLKIPQRLESFKLANGLAFEAKSPHEYRIDYVGVHDTEIHLDFTGIHEPYDIHDPKIDPLAQVDTGAATQHSGFGAGYANHFDLTMKAVGTVKVRGKEYQVNCLATNDHSWGPRAERGMKMMGYLNAHFDEDYVVQSIWEFDAARPDGQQHKFKHGYAVVNGKLLGGVGGTLRVNHNGIFPDSLELSVTDTEGTLHALTGTPLAYTNWMPYGCCHMGHSMLAWETPNRKGGIGTFMETYPLDTVTGGYIHEDIRNSIRR
jgi:hypothetical protein